MTAQLSYWVLPVADTERAVAFFSAVLGWEFSEPGSMGGRHVLDSEPWGGIGPAESGGPSAPRLAFSPDDLDAAIARVRDLGGTATESAEASGYGRWVECTDDQGTAFALFTAAVAD